jgi:hypothetical protein
MRWPPQRCSQAGSWRVPSEAAPKMVVERWNGRGAWTIMASPDPTARCSRCPVGTRRAVLRSAEPGLPDTSAFNGPWSSSTADDVADYLIRSPGLTRDDPFGAVRTRVVVSRSARLAQPSEASPYVGAEFGAFLRSGDGHCCPGGSEVILGAWRARRSCVVGRGACAAWSGTGHIFRRDGQFGGWRPSRRSHV